MQRDTEFNSNNIRLKMFVDRKNHLKATKRHRPAHQEKSAGQPNLKTRKDYAQAF